MANVMAFVDGFNLYHALDKRDAWGDKPFQGYKWLNYWALCERYVAPGDALAAVYWFTAYVPWKSSSGKAKKARHRILVAANRNLGVLVEWGRFRPVSRRCRAFCGVEYRTYEEKRTDVKIALHIQKLAYERAYTKGILISGDSDLVPAVEIAASIDPDIRFLNVLPVGQNSAELSRIKHAVQIHMTRGDLSASRLPDRVVLASGAELRCPKEWMCPKEEAAPPKDGAGPTSGSRGNENRS